jgi:hypothetical protein
MNQDTQITLLKPIYLLKSAQRCYMCKAMTEVYCLASNGFIEGEFEVHEFTQYSAVRELPVRLQAILKRQAPTYYLDYIKQRANCYFINHCRCGTKLADFYLHNQPDAAFNPGSAEQASKIMLYELDIVEKNAEQVAISATVVVNDIDLIAPHAQRLGL